jgi:hypothetical protein
MVVEDDHDNVSFREVVLELDEPGHRRAGRVAAKIPSSRVIRRIIIAASLSVTFSNGR